MSQLQYKQPEIYQLFNRIIQNNSLKHAYLFEGYSGTGKLEMSRYIAKSQLCFNSEGNEPCLECTQCHRIANGEHPDVIEVFPEGKSQSIKVERIRQLKDEFSKSGVEGKRKFIIVDKVDSMTISASNSLLKFLEEPDGDVTIFLLTSNKQNILPTIISRCQVISFSKQPLSQRISELKEEGLNDFEAHLVAHLTQDNQLGKELIEEYELMDKAEKVWRWFNRIIKDDPVAFVMVQTELMPIINDRQEASVMLDLILYLYRDLLQLYFNQENSLVAFNQYRHDLAYYTEKMSLNTITNGITSILKAKRQLNSHVATQGVLENLSLELQKMSI